MNLALLFDVAFAVESWADVSVKSDIFQTTAQKYKMLKMSKFWGNRFRISGLCELFVEENNCQLTGNICHDISRVQAPQILGTISRVQGLT